MKKPVQNAPKPGDPKKSGYIIVLFVIILGFFGVLAAMHVLVIVSVGTASRSYDVYRQSVAEMLRLTRAVDEAMLQLEQISVAAAPTDIAATVAQQVSNLTAGGATITTTMTPSSVPTIVTFPSSTATVDPLVSVPSDLQTYLSPELANLIGPRVAVYPAVSFQFSSTRDVLDKQRTYSTEVDARLVAVPLTRFPIAAYDLPAEAGSVTTVASSSPAPSMPGGLVPSRDPAFVQDLQSQSGVLPYHYRRRALLAGAYQYVFSQAYIDRVSEYAGVTHYHDMDTVGSTGVLNGMTVSGSTTSWDVGQVYTGTYNTITLSRDAAVIFTNQTGKTLRLFDSVGDASAPAMLILVIGPSDASTGALTLDLGTISRPVVIIGYNVRVIGEPSTGINGALFLDTNATVDPTNAISVGHLSYWAGSTGIPANAFSITAMPTAAEALAPRVVYVASKAFHP